MEKFLLKITHIIFKGLSLDLEGNDSYLWPFIVSHEILFFGEGRLTWPVDAYSSQYICIEVNE